MLISAPQASRQARVVTVLLFVLSSVAVGTSAPAVVPNTSEGFDQQYRAVWKAVRAGKSAEAERLELQFRMPSSWFGEYFGGQRAAEMEHRYSRAFSAFRANAFSFTYGKTVASGLTTGPASDVVERRLDDRPVAGLLKPLPMIQYFSVSMGDASAPPSTHPPITGNFITWLGTSPQSFVYVDGTFRYFGGTIGPISEEGSYPFWELSELGGWDPCLGSKGKGGSASNKVVPEYPEDALKEGLQAKILLVVTITEEGAVRSVNVVRGMRILEEAAVAAVKRWTFLPFIECDRPVERWKLIHVDFDIYHGKAYVDAY